MLRRPLRLVGALALAAFGAAGAAQADKLKNPTAVFSGLDKITGRIISFEVAVDETVQFGALQLTPKTCYSRPPTENPHTTGFVEVDEVTLDNKYRRIFNGWMFASSPGLHGIEHAIYDVWLTDCKGGTDVIAERRVNLRRVVARGRGGIAPARLFGPQSRICLQCVLIMLGTVHRVGRRQLLVRARQCEYRFDACVGIGR